MEMTNRKCPECVYSETCLEDPTDCHSYIDRNTVAYGTIAAEDSYQDSIAVGYGMPKVKSYLTVGNLVIHNTHHFNWFERKMWKLLLGFDIENVEE